MDPRSMFPPISSLIKNEDMIIDSPIGNMWAESLFEILKEKIKDFEEHLDTDHEVGIMLTNFGQSILMQVTEVSYKSPVLMIFKGYVNGQESTLIQHINQLSFMLTAMEKAPEKQKAKIGFSED